MSTTKVQSDMVDIDGATTATIATGDKVNFLDITDSLVKEDTVQGILDLAAGGATVLVGTHERTSAGASLDVTGIDSTYDTYLIYGTDIVPGTDNTDIYFRVGDSSGFDSGASDYCWDTVQNELAGTSWAQTGDEDNADSQIAMNSFIQHAAGSGTSETVSIFLTLQGMGDSPGFPNIRGDQFLYSYQPAPFITRMGGARLATITGDRVQLLAASGNIKGRLTVLGVKHA